MRMSHSWSGGDKVNCKLVTVIKSLIMFVWIVPCAELIVVAPCEIPQAGFLS